jgi:hypothetical protein
LHKKWQKNQRKVENSALAKRNKTAIMVQLENYKADNERL